MRSVGLWIVPVILAAGAAGCGPYQGTRTVVPPLETKENLVYLDAAETTAIPCEHLSSQRLESGRLRVLARFFNTQNQTAECQVQVRFKDASGKIVDETGWMPLLLPRRQTTQFEHTSLTTEAQDFVLMLRKAKGKK